MTTFVVGLTSNLVPPTPYGVAKKVWKIHVSLTIFRVVDCVEESA